MTPWLCIFHPIAIHASLFFFFFSMRSSFLLCLSVCLRVSRLFGKGKEKKKVFSTPPVSVSASASASEPATTAPKMTEPELCHMMGHRV